MTANVTVHVSQHEDVMRVPNAALRFHPPDAAGGRGGRGMAGGPMRGAGSQGGASAERAGPGGGAAAGAAAGGARWRAAARSAAGAPDTAAMAGRWQHRGGAGAGLRGGWRQRGESPDS